MLSTIPGPRAIIRNTTSITGLMPKYLNLSTFTTSQLVIQVLIPPMEKNRTFLN